MVLMFVTPASAQLDSGLTTARDLYASARYDEALALLNGMRPGEGLVQDRKSIEQYRWLCLLALGRGTEAESAIAAVVTADPLFQPGEADASPRVRGAFSDVRQRLLPEIASARYTSAKATFDRKDFAAAGQQFKELLTLLDDPQMGGRLKDLRVLVNGFLALSAAGAAPPAPSSEPKEEGPKPAPAPSPAMQAPGPRSASHIWNAVEPGVTPPTVIRQGVPRVPPAIASQARDGMVEIVIDEQGRVTSISIRTSLHVMYDPLLLTAAREWRYEPATVDGAPVKFRKLVQIVVDKR
jgi:TonB family protein